VAIFSRVTLAPRTNSTSMSHTVLGASGFIGSHLVRWLESQRVACWTPGRGADVLARPLGHVIYCIGITADFRRRPYDTVRAHVCTLLDLLEKADFASLLYLSTTRLYAGLEDTHEDQPLRVNPSSADDLYNISKIMGESMCLSSGRANVRVVRLSNVYGKDISSENFLTSVLRDAVEHKKVVLRTSLDSEKDYVNVDDVVRLLPQIACSGRHRIYNVAAGVNATHRELVDVVERATGCRVEVAEGRATVRFPPVCIERVQQEFGFAPSRVLDSLSALIAEYKRRSLGT
jgi:nucleoside-diphosphate-sugar epimerase